MKKSQDAEPACMWLSGALRTPHLSWSPLCPALGYNVSSFSNGFPGCPGEALRFSAPRRPSTSSLRHPSLGEESTHALIAPDEQVSKQLARPSPLVLVGMGPQEHAPPPSKDCGEGKRIGRIPHCPKKGRQLPWKVWRTRKRRKCQLFLPGLLFPHPGPSVLSFPLPLGPPASRGLFASVPHLCQHASR